MSDFKGIIPAVVTPFDRDGKFNPSAFEQLLERLYAADVDGMYLCGQTGEGFVQPIEQREEVTTVAVKNSPSGKSVIVHVGAASTADAIRLANHAGRAGAHAVSSLPPIGSYSFLEIKKYYETLAAASELPLLVYYFPAVAPAITNADQIKELCDIENVIGLKFTAYDLFTMSIVKQHGATVFNGYDEVLVAGLLMGADGGIGTFYNLVPELFMEMYRLSRDGKWQEAKAIQLKINSLIEASIRFPVFPTVKKLLQWSGIDCGECRAPRRSLTSDEESELRAAILKLDFADTFPNINSDLKGKTV